MTQTKNTADPAEPSNPSKVKTTSDGHLDEDVLCIGCRYNLRGLTRDKTCPECGVSVSETTRSMEQFLSSRRKLAKHLFWVALGAILLLGWLGYKLYDPLSVQELENFGVTFWMWTTFTLVLALGVWLSIGQAHLRFYRQWVARNLQWSLLIMFGLTLALEYLRVEYHQSYYRNNNRYLNILLGNENLYDFVLTLLENGCLHSIVLTLTGVVVLIGLARLTKVQNARWQCIFFLCLLLPWLLTGVLGVAFDGFVFVNQMHNYGIWQGSAPNYNTISMMRTVRDYYFMGVISCGIAALGLLIWFRLMLFRLSRQVADSQRRNK